MPFLNNDAPTVVVSLSVPPGNFSIIAVVPVANHDANGDQTGECRFTAPVDVMNSPNFGHAVLRLEAAGTNNFDHGHLVLIGTGSFLINSTITVSCTGFLWQVLQPAIMATKVGALH